jgi:hypothetical protein
MHGGYHPLLSHKCGLQIDTLGRARQMWAERYILVSEGNAGADAGQGRMQGKTPDAGRDVETDVAIEDEC